MLTRLLISVYQETSSLRGCHTTKVDECQQKVDKDTQGRDEMSEMSSGLECVKGADRKGRRFRRNAQVGNQASASTKKRAIEVGEAEIKDELKGEEKED